MKMKKYLSLLILLILTVNVVQSQQIERMSASHSAVVWRNASDDCTDPVAYELPTQSILYYNHCLKKLRFWDTLVWSNIGAGEAGIDGTDGADGIQGIQGIPGIDGADGADGATGSGVTIRGSDTIANILLISGIAGDLWISTSVGVDNNGTAVAVGDGIVSDGTLWLTVGPIRGPIGATGATGLQGAQGIQGLQGIQGIPGADGIDGTNGIDGSDAPADGVITNIELVGTNLVVDGTVGAETVDVDLSSLTNTDDQTIALVGTVLSIEGGNSQELSGINTDNQNLVITGDVLSIENGTGSVDLGLRVPYTGATTDVDLGANTLTSTGFIDSDGTANLTGSTIDLGDNVTGNIYYSNSIPSENLTLTVANLKQGGFAVYYTNTQEEPQFTNATIKGNSTWVADTTLQIFVYSHDGISAEYFYGNSTASGIAEGTVLTGTVIDLGNFITGNVYYSKVAPNTTSPLSLSVTDLTVNGYAVYYVNTLEEPTFTNATINGTSTWIANETLQLFVYSHDGVNAEYFFANAANGSTPTLQEVLVQGNIGTTGIPIILNGIGSNEASYTGDYAKFNSGLGYSAITASFLKMSAINGDYTDYSQNNIKFTDSILGVSQNLNITSISQNGTITIPNATGEMGIVNGYKLPLADGTINQVIKTNGSGVLTFGDASVIAEVNNLTSAVTWANIPIGNVPTGTTGTTVAFGNHLHTGVYLPSTTEFQSPLEIYSESGTLLGGNGIGLIGDFDPIGNTGSGIYFDQNYDDGKDLIDWIEIHSADDLSISSTGSEISMGGGINLTGNSITSTSTGSQEHTGSNLTFQANSTNIMLAAASNIRIAQTPESVGVLNIPATSFTASRTQNFQDADGTIALLDDTAFAASWDGDIVNAPTKNSVYDYVNGLVTGGAVDSVNTQTGVVVLDTDDILDTATNRYTNDTDITRLANTSGTNTGDQNLSTYLIDPTTTAGDIIWRNALGNIDRIGVGAENDLLGISGGAVKWVNPPVDQTLSNTSDASSHTATLSASGGSVKLIEGTGITLTTAGTALDGTVTIASTGGGGTEFADDVFRVTGSVDATKKLAFEVDGNATGNTTIVTIQDKAGIMAYTSDITNLAEEDVVGGASENTSVGATLALDLNTFSYFEATLTVNTEILTPTNLPGTGQSVVKTIVIIPTAAETLQLPVAWTVIGTYDSSKTNYLTITFSNVTTGGAKALCYINN